MLIYKQDVQGGVDILAQEWGAVNTGYQIFCGGGVEMDDQKIWVETGYQQKGGLDIDNRNRSKECSNLRLLE